MANLVHDPALHKLGCKPPAHDPRTLDLATYLDLGALPPPPAQRSWMSPGIAWGLMRNDRENCCTVAALGHTVQAWTTATFGSTATVTDDQVEVAYRAVSPADTGADLLTVQNYFRNVGVGGHRSWAFAKASPNRPRLVMESINLFGAHVLGLYLPVAAQHQEVWDVPPGGTHGDGAINSWGGHAVAVLAYDPGGLACVTWGQPKRLTWDFVRTYGMDGFAMLGFDFVNGDRRAPNGFNLAALKADLAALGRA